MTSRDLSKIISLKITVEPVKKCWFIKGRDWSIYTTIKGERAHRFVYELCKGKLLEGLFICHNCDRKGCINPDHLFQGTHTDNMQDAMNKYKVKSPLCGLIMNKRISELRRIDNDRQLPLRGTLNADWHRR